MRQHAGRNLGPVGGGPKDENTVSEVVVVGSRYDEGGGYYAKFGLGFGPGFVLTATPQGVSAEVGVGFFGILRAGYALSDADLANVTELPSMFFSAKAGPVTVSGQGDLDTHEVGLELGPVGATWGGQFSVQSESGIGVSFGFGSFEIGVQAGVAPVMVDLGTRDWLVP